MGETAMPSGLEATIDEAILRLAELRSTRIARQQTRIDEEDPDDLRALAALTIDVARVIDPLFQEIAYQAGLSSRSGASEHARLVIDAIEGNLDYELVSAAEKIEDERAVRFDAQREEWGTLNHAQQLGRVV
jgi:hypothetical protein